MCINDLACKRCNNFINGHTSTLLVCTSLEKRRIKLDAEGELAVNRILGLDGLRGIAVLAVVVYHADLGFLYGGFLGVDVFFVLSGFLITQLLLREISQTGGLDRANFYLGRIRRLLPALLLMLLVMVVISGLWVPDAAFGIRRDLPWALTFVLNWSYLFFEQSYFVNIARQPLVQHLWSLAIEEQFYVIWPLVVIGLHKLSRRIGRRGISLRKLIAGVAIVGAVASTLWMQHLSITHGYPLPQDPSRVYFGTDTHLMGLLLGCATAALWKPETFRSKLTPDRAALMTVLGWSAMAFILFCFINVGELTPWLYRTGFLWLALATAITVYLATHPALHFGRVLSFPILRWLGDRSYGIYLWHWPIFLLLRPSLDVDWPDAFTHILRFALVLSIAEISYRYIEMPVRRGVLTERIRRWKIQGIPRPTAPLLLACLATVLTSTVALGQIATTPTPSLGNATAFGGLTAIDEDPTPGASPAPEKTNVQVAITKPQPVRAPSATVFGDSVVLGTRFALQSILKKVSIDAAVGRQPWEMAERIRIRKREGRLSKDVVIHMGTNGLVRAQDLQPILELLKDRRRVVVVNVQVPRVWMDGSNKTIASVIQSFPNVRLANWNKVSRGHQGYFVPDGVHLTPIGGKVFARLIDAQLSAP